MIAPRLCAVLVMLGGVIAASAHAQIAITQVGSVDSTGRCTIRPTVGATVYANMIAGDLSHAEILHHAASRLGYGASPIGPLTVAAANDCTTVFVADELVRQIGKLGATARAPELTTIRRGALPLTMYSGTEISAALWRLKATSAAGASAAGSVGWEARTQLATLKTLRELVGSQRLSGTTLVDVQLNVEEVMLELWLNHFNVELEKAGYHSHGKDGYSEVIRTAHGGTFATLLRAVIREPAMLVYLDNKANHCDPVTGVASNQNLARELLELHTLGVPPTAGVYGQQDVEAVASALCGWNAVGTSTPLPAGASEFVYNDMLASTKPLVILGTTFQPTGESRVLAVLDHLANHARTRTSICNKVAARLYAPSLRSAAASACVTAWGTTGDVSAIVTALVQRTAFWTAANYRMLQRSPIELVVAVARATGIKLTDLAAATTTTETAFDPATMTPAIVDQLTALRSTVPHRTLMRLMDRITVMLGASRMRIAPPIGYPMDGSAFLSPSYIDDASRLGFEVAGLLNQMPNRTDLSSTATRTALDDRLSSSTPAATLEWFIEQRMKLGNVISGTASAAFTIAASHVSYLTAVFGNKSAWAVHANYPTIPRSNDTLLGLMLGSAYELWR